MILVAIVVLLFLQNWRSAMIPLIAVPVAIIGTFGVMAAMGFSLNNLTLFGLVLAIGIVVDDAIVVVEAVEHHIEHGMAPREATIRAMDEVSGPVIAIGLVLSAVFVPCAFISGIIGQFFRQFALTIASSTMISAFNSLTLSPALAAVLLRPRDQQATARCCRGWRSWSSGGWLGYARAGAAARARVACSPSLPGSACGRRPPGGWRWPLLRWPRARLAGWLAGPAAQLAPERRPSGCSTGASIVATNRYTRIVGMAAAGQRARARWSTAACSS